jgi:hypothetical protein
MPRSSTHRQVRRRRRRRRRWDRGVSKQRQQHPGAGRTDKHVDRLRCGDGEVDDGAPLRARRRQRRTKIGHHDVVSPVAKLSAERGERQRSNERAVDHQHVDDQSLAQRSSAAARHWFSGVERSVPLQRGPDDRPIRAARAPHRPSAHARGVGDRREHAPLYWFPRDCPRVTAWPRDAQEGIAFRIAFATRASRVHAIELGWLDRMRATALYRYALDASAFSPWPDATGQWICSQEIEPLSVAPVGDLLAEHARAGIELRLVPSLWPLHGLAVSSRWDFSIVRMTNALPDVVGVTATRTAAECRVISKFLDDLIAAIDTDTDRLQDR